MFRLPRRGLWRHPDFLLLWSAQGISAVGSRITRTALPIAAIVTADAGAIELGFLTVALTLPGAILAWVGGGLVDRRRRRPLMIGADFVRALALLTIPIAAFFGHVTLSLLLAVAIVTGVATMLYSLADHVFITGLVAPKRLLDANGKRLLMEADATDILNVHGQVTDVMRIGWLAADRGVPVSLGNTFLEVGIHMACALPEVQWLEYSFQNFDHLVDQPVEIRDGWAFAPDRPGHGLVLSETARRDWARPRLLPRSELGEAPFNPRVGTSLRAA